MLALQIAARVLAAYLVPGCVGRGARLGSENSSGAGAVGGVWKSGNLETWDLEIQKFGVQKIKKIKILKIQIRSAQNVGKVWISRNKSSCPYLGPSEAIFSMDRTNAKNAKKNAYFP